MSIKPAAVHLQTPQSCTP